jgi:hypothetical protein
VAACWPIRRLAGGEVSRTRWLELNSDSGTRFEWLEEDEAHRNQASHGSGGRLVGSCWWPVRGGVEELGGGPDK